jgi:hypothetical protein
VRLPQSAATLTIAFRLQERVIRVNRGGVRGRFLRQKEWRALKHFRVSIRGLMVMIVLWGAALAALRFPTPLWANVWYSLTVASLTLAVPAAIYRRGQARAFWVGYAACGWVYFVFALAPWLQGEGGFQFVSTTILDLLAPRLVQKDDLLRTYGAGFRPQYAPTQPTPWQVWNLPEFPPENPWHRVGYVTVISPGIYLRIGHAFFCILIAHLGGLIVRYLATTCPPGILTER